MCCLSGTKFISSRHAWRIGKRLPGIHSVEKTRVPGPCRPCEYGTNAECCADVDSSAAVLPQPKRPESASDDMRANCAHVELKYSKVRAAGSLSREARRIVEHTETSETVVAHMSDSLRTCRQLPRAELLSMSEPTAILRSAPRRTEKLFHNARVIDRPATHSDVTSSCLRRK